MIMGNVRLLGTAFFLVFVVSVGVASGGTINLSGGSMDFPSLIDNGRTHLVGDRDFTFDGLAEADHSPCIPLNFCLPGDTVNLSVSFGNLRGVATLDGISYTEVGGFDSPDFMHINITGEAIAPPFGTSATATLVVPVTFTGTFSHGAPAAEGETLVAGAIATVTLISFELPTGRRVWEGISVTYDIVAFLPVAIDIKPKRSNCRVTATFAL
jgi:hypothetical protein